MRCPFFIRLTRCIQVASSAAGGAFIATNASPTSSQSTILRFGFPVHN